MYYALAAIFFLTILTGVLVIVGFYFLRTGSLKVAIIYFCWLLLYSLFIIFGTGPIGERTSPSHLSPYKLPWKSGISRFVSQGNRSFTSHRGAHTYAWDFWMSIGSEVLASRSGIVIKVEETFDGIGIHSNFIMIEHNDGTRALYAHIRKMGAVVEVNDRVEQGQMIAYSGMVGQTINPHLHFVVLNNEETESLPITFSDCNDDGVPLAGRSYTSRNTPP